MRRRRGHIDIPFLHLGDLRILSHTFLFFPGVRPLIFPFFLTAAAVPGNILVIFTARKGLEIVLSP